MTIQRFLLCLVALTAVFALPVYAQKKPRPNSEVLVTFDVCAPDVTYNPNWPNPPYEGLNFRVVDLATVQEAFNGSWNGIPGNGGQITHSGQFYIKLQPNRLYEATHTLLGGHVMAWGEVKISAPAGYTVYINNIARETLRVSGNSTYGIVIRENGDSSELPAGMAMAPQIADFSWALSTGSFATGLLGNPIQLRATNLSSAMLNAASLSYVTPYSPEYSVTRHSDGGLLELESFQAIIYLRRNSPAGGYTLEVYSPYATRTGSGDGPYTYDEQPYREFRFSNPDVSWNNRIKIEKIERDGSVTRSTAWTISQNGSTWTSDEISGERTINIVSSVVAGNRQEEVQVTDGTNVATKIKRFYQSFSWGQEELVKETANPDATNGPALTTDYDYYTSGAGGYGRLKSVKYPDGSWVRWDYDDSIAGLGNLVTAYHPWQDGTATPDTATTTNCQTENYTYQAERAIFNEWRSGVVTKILGTVAGGASINYNFASGSAPNGEPLRTETVGVSTGNDTLTSVRKVYHTVANSNWRNRLFSATNPDGSKTSFLRYQGYWWNYGENNSTNLHRDPWQPQYNNIWGEYEFHGFSTAVTSAVLVNSWDSQTIDSVYMVPNVSTVSLAVYNDLGLVAYRVNYVFTGASSGVPSFEFLSMQTTTFTDGVATAVVGTDGSLSQISYDLGQVTGQTGNDGSSMVITRDDLGRDITVTRTGVGVSGEYPAQSDVYRHRTFDVANRILTEKISNSSNAADPGPKLVNSYNPAGQLYQQVSASGLTTTYTYTNGGRTVTVKHPGDSVSNPITTVSDRYLDGTAKSISGTAQVASFTKRTLSAVTGESGYIQTISYTGTSADNGSRWTRITTDLAGRVVKEERPAPPGVTPATFTKRYYFNAVGQLAKVTEDGLADTLYKYNAWQQPYRVGLDLGANGSGVANGELDTDSLDRITETESVFEKDASLVWWSKVTTKKYNADNSSTVLTASVVKTRACKFSGNVQSEVVGVDITNNTMRRSVTVDRSLRLVTETTDVPDSSVDELTVTRNGRLQKRRTKENLSYFTYYDSLGRAIKTTDPRADSASTARTGYYGDTAAVGNRYQIAWQQDTAGNQTDYTYESTTGLLSTTTLPTPAVGQSRPVTRYAYSARSEQIRVWGTGTYPIEYEYNAYGERVKQRTWNTTPAGVDFTDSSWSSATYPSTTGNITLWAFDPASGTLTAKTDAASKPVSYTYNIRGQLKNRVWARGGTTVYDFDPKTAEMLSITYPAGTPNISGEYNRLGQLKQVDDATGTRYLDHCVCGKLSVETLSAYFGDRLLTYKLDQVTTGALGRTKGYTLGAGTTIEQDIAYGFDAYGRLNAVTTTPSGFGATTFSYGYAADSNLISSVSDATSGWAQSRAYLSNRNLIDVIETKVGAASKAKFDYDYDALGQRLNVVQTGEMFSRYVGAGTVPKWTYNERGELSTAQTYNGVNPLDTSNPVLGRNFSYNYDNLGSRTSATVDGVSATYTPNNLNQYSDRVVPGVARIAGLAPANAAISVNGSTAGITRQGDYYYQSLTVANSIPVSPQIAIASSYGGSATRSAYFAASPEVFAYDDDGNLIRDGRWVYQYDAENRLVVMFTRGAPEDPLSSATANVAVWNSGVARQRIEYIYDYMGRRVRKSVFNRSGSSWVAGPDTKFIYDGWNLIAEYAVSGSALTLNRSHTWGLDWSGSRQGLGGVGGLLQTANYTGGSVRYLPAYDGNGNVAAMVNQSDGMIAAAFEYSPFGELIRATGPAQDKCLFRFSTKYADTESGLVYYGRRYYSPSVGRFINRDSIEESGGINLYAFVGNNPVDNIDYLGNLLIPVKHCKSTRIPASDIVMITFEEETCWFTYDWMPDPPVTPGNNSNNGNPNNPGNGNPNGPNTGNPNNGNPNNPIDPNNGNPKPPVAPKKEPNKEICDYLRQQMTTAMNRFDGHHRMSQVRRDMMAEMGGLRSVAGDIFSAAGKDAADAFIGQAFDFGGRAEWALGGAMAYNSVNTFYEGATNLEAGDYFNATMEIGTNAGQAAVSAGRLYGARWAARGIPGLNAVSLGYDIGSIAVKGGIAGFGAKWHNDEYNRLSSGFQDSIQTMDLELGTMDDLMSLMKEIGCK